MTTKYTLRLVMSDEITTIKVSKTLRDELVKLGSKGETYDTIIRRLLGATTRE
jgi:hypothetical protein